MSSYIIRSEDKLLKSDYQSIASLLLDKLKECYERTILIDSSSGREWTGDEVYELALNLSHYLIKECHINPSSVVCFICADSDIHLIASVAVLSAAGVYCALPSISTYREIESALTRIEPEFVVTDEYNYGITATIAAELKSIQKIFIIDEKSVTPISSHLDVIENVLQFERSFLLLPVDSSPDDTSALTITSAADGTTNAVIRSNRNLIATATALQTPEVTVEDKVLITGLHTHSGLALLLHAINTMSTVVIADRNDTIGDKLMALIDRFGITTVLMNDSQLYYYLENNDNISGLKTIWFTGSNPNSNHLFKLNKIKNFRKVFTTPETGWVSTILNQRQFDKNQKTVGKPVAGVEIKIVDSSGQSVPFNTEGEVYVRSAQCSKGYLNNPIDNERLLTADRFIKTGEYGLYDREGVVHIRGHSEEFVKVDDFMISCEELESILLKRIDVKESAVICGEDRNGSQTIKALVTMKSDHRLDFGCRHSAEEDIRQFVNLRVEPRKWITEKGLEILSELPRRSLATFTFETEEEYV